MSKKALGIVGVAAVFAGGVMGAAECFTESKQNAKEAGKLLACALALREPFRAQSISIVAFSLGNQVMKTCLKTLAKLGATNVVQNVTFLGAAIDLPDKAKTREKMA